MDTTSFKNALRRFLAVRGACRLLRSDNGTNFVGSKNQDEENLNLEEVKKSLRDRNCTWHFNPPHASHFDGVWERKIGSVKQVLEASLLTLSLHTLSRDELHTLLLEAAAIVNATSLWEVSSDPKDPMPLSPATILTLKNDPHPSTGDSFNQNDVLSYGRKRWRRVQALAEEVWQQWRTHFLSTLQHRRKWLTPKRSIMEGDVIILRNKAEKRNEWPLARVHEIRASADGLVRSATVVTLKKDAKGNLRRSFFNRPVCDMVLLIPENKPAVSENGSVETNQQTD